MKGYDLNNGIWLSGQVWQLCLLERIPSPPSEIIVDEYQKKKRCQTLDLDPLTKYFGSTHDMYIVASHCFPTIVTIYICASTLENLSSGVCEQHRRRPGCASAQSDQRLCYSHFGKYHI